MHLTDIEVKIMENSRRQATGGIDLFWMYWSAPEDGTQDQARGDLLGISADKYVPPLQPGQFIPIRPLPWISRIVHGFESQTIIIGGVGSGKTLNMVLAAGYYCCMLPNFRYLGTAPISWQADLSYREFMSFVLDQANQDMRPRRINRWIRNVRLRPYPMVEFVNGSTMEFKSLDKDASSIMTWSGDMAVVDQAEDQSIDLEQVLSNLGTRLRGQIDGRVRLGKLVVMANSAYNPTLWEIYDAFDADPNQLAMTLTSYDNPYLTEKQLRSMERTFRDKDEQARLMRSERPLPKGKEFTQELVVRAQSESLDTLMQQGIDSGDQAFVLEDSASAGVVKWMLPYHKGHLYIMTGDPGQANPPYRNSPVIVVFDVTQFPHEPATLAAFVWPYGYGSYWPFINTMDLLHETYHPYMAAFDATGIQRAFDELGVLDENKLWMPLDMTSLKMHMVLCLKVLMGKGLVQIPKKLYSVWNQLLMWCMPDKQLRQDIASAMFMTGYLLNQILPQSATADLELEQELSSADRWTVGRVVHQRATMRSIP
jgi:hypothetical protein